ncbi:MAG: RNA-binding protein [Lachnospiraceae bacterium]|nr:RNA-binding protein [Lachnospiraceae bacterium]
MELGKINTVKIARMTPHGAYITDADDEHSTLVSDAESEGRSALPVSDGCRSALPVSDGCRSALPVSDGVPTRGTITSEILLPNGEMTAKLSKGDITECFIYLDSEDRPIATMKRPLLTLGETAVLTCLEVTQLGTFLDWGLKKDLFLPYREQTRRPKQGSKVLVALYIDKSGRLCATMKLYKYLRNDSPYKTGDRVLGRIYETGRDEGAHVAVDGVFRALIPKKDLVTDVNIGDEIRLRVARVLPDGKLVLAMRDPSHIQIYADCELILGRLEAAPGHFLPVHDKTDTDVIRRTFGMSKNSFKRAVGHLMKEGKISQDLSGIKLNPTE